LCFSVFSVFYKKTIIIDDLDRSSMSAEDQWAMLANLWPQNVKYIVLLGYESPDKKSEVLEMANKLEGEIILLPCDQDTNMSLVQDLKKDPDFPFTGDDSNYSDINSLDWMNYITPRQLISIVEEVRAESRYPEFSLQVFKVFSYTTKIIDLLSFNLGLNNFDRQHIVYQSGVNDINRRFHDADNPREALQLRFFTKSELSTPLSIDIIKKVYKSLNPKSKEAFEVVFNDLSLSQRGSFSSIFRFNMPPKEISKLFGASFKKVKNL